MRVKTMVRVLLPAVVSLTAGCGLLIGYEDATLYQPDGGAAGGSPDGCDPSKITVAVADSCGVFVSPTGEDTNAGTKDKPVKTLGVAIARGLSVYACAGATPYSETLVVDGAVTLYGGLDCAKGWVYDATRKTVLTADKDSVPLTLTSTATGAEVQDFAITAADATKAAASSIAVLVDHATVTLTRCALVAGDAANGEVGANGGPQELTAPAGAPGGAAGTTGMGSLKGGNAGANTICPLAGGNGGNGGFIPSGFGADGAGGDNNTGGAAGTGETATAVCTAGATGDAGMTGPSGVVAPGIGTLGKAGYLGIDGQPGMDGATGTSAGGGGGSKASSTAHGAGGGGGGAGGCGGKGPRMGKSIDSMAYGSTDPGCDGPRAHQQRHAQTPADRRHTFVVR